MVRNAAGKVVWVGKGVVFLVGLVAILAVVFAVANALVGAGSDLYVSGEPGRVDPVS